MIYNNLIYLLVVILILSTNTVPEAVQTPFHIALFFFVAKGIAFQITARRFFSTAFAKRAGDYFSAEQKLSVLAIASLAIDVYLLDYKYYAALLPLTKQIPALIDFGGILLFHFYLALMWKEGAKSYQALFGRETKKSRFILDNFNTNLTIVLPWLVLSLLSDLLKLIPSQGLKRFLASTWGEPLIILIFFLMLAVIFPVIVTRLWKCSPMPQGPVRAHIEAFCKRQNLQYADIMIWPLYGGKVLTAGIMGISKRFRYLLITPALLTAMTAEEVEAVLAHEIGHVKWYHLQLYIFFFLGFGLISSASLYPILYSLMNSDFFYKAILAYGKAPGSAITLFGTVSMFLIMVLYFRFLFGFFMRNFERQADLHAFEIMGGGPIIRVFEKISFLSGNIRDVPSWHHFSIAQRVDYLEKCERDSSFVDRHHRKVYSALILYVSLLIVGGFLLWKTPTEIQGDATREKFAKAVLLQKIEEDPKNPLWHHWLGDLHLGTHEYKKAIAKYEDALKLSPYRPDSLNNLAWLLITAEDEEVLDPKKALSLAEEAVNIKPKSYILDTLAAAYWANGYQELAIKTEKQAIILDPGKRKIYEKNLELFQSGPWSAEKLRDAENLEK